jgi:signal transduction histidine kinase
MIKFDSAEQYSSHMQDYMTAIQRTKTNYLSLSITMKRTKLLCIFGIFIGVLFSGNMLSQSLEKNFDFDSIYLNGMGNVQNNLISSKNSLKILESYKKQLTPIQQAKTNYLRLTVIYSDPDMVKELERRMFEAPDSLVKYDALVYSAQKYLEKSMPDKAIPLLMEAIYMVGEGSGEMYFCKINLCEAYRQKQEYSKGIEMLNEMLLNANDISDFNRAFACNRLAAIYDEWGTEKYSTTDSVKKYSYLCISISEKINSQSNLALAQNELSYLLYREKQYYKALEISITSVKNFDDADMFYCEMNALINLSNIYIGLKDYDNALKAIEDATFLCEIEENRNLFMRLYLQMAVINNLKQNYKDAYEFMFLSRNLLNDFYRDRISTQINEQSAKYDLFNKEQRIKQEEQQNKFQKKQFTFLILILVILCIAFILSLLYIRLKRKQIISKKTIEAVILTEEKERKRLASELHDGLGPVLSAVNLYFQAYLDAPESQKPEIETQLKKIIDNVIIDVSRISQNISPQILEKYGLITALETFINQIRLSEKIKFFDSFEKLNRFDLKTELTIYRTVAELINNTIKHAGADEIHIKIFLSGTTINVEFKDNGKGFDVKKTEQSKAGMGLTNIYNRVNSLNGKLSIISSENKGILVQISLPYYTNEN